MKKPLYVKRRVLNGEAIYTWMRQNGIKNPTSPDDLHVTQVFSKTPVFKSKFVLDPSRIKISSLGRDIEQLGDMTALNIASPTLQARFDYFKKGGCSWDFPSYRPHISLYKGEVDKNLPVYKGDIILGGEEAEDLDLGKGEDAVSTYSTNANKVLAALEQVILKSPEDIDAIIATIKTDFVQMVVEAAKPFKFKVTAKNPVQNTVTLRYKTMTMIINPQIVTTMFYAKGLDEYNAPGFMPIPTPKTKRGITGLFKKLVKKYDRVVNDSKDLYKESKDVEKLNKRLKLDGVIDRLGISITDSLKADEEI